ILRGHTQMVSSVNYSPDGRRLVSRDKSGRTLVWDAVTGKLLPKEPAPATLSPDNRSPDGRGVAVPVDDVVRIYRRPPPGGYDPWAEAEERRQILAPRWHAEDAAGAEQRGDWFAAVFHRRRLASIRPEDRPNRALLARALANLGRWQEALDTCGLLLENDPTLVPVYLERARLRLALGDRASATVDTLTGLGLASRS